MTATPNGCQHCGIPERAHWQQWNEAAGWHQWTAPTDTQILARMLTRRSARLAPTEQSAAPELMVTITLDAQPLLDAFAAAQQALNGNPTTETRTP